MPWAAILTATQIKIPEAWQLPCQAHTTQLAKHSSFGGKLKHSKVKLPGCLLTLIKFFWSRTYLLWFSWADFNSPPGSDSTLHSLATEWNMLLNPACRPQNLIFLTHCRTPRNKAQIAPALWVLKAYVAQWAAQAAADSWWRQRQGDECSCRRSYWLIKHPVDQLWIANALPWCVCCGKPVWSLWTTKQGSKRQQNQWMPLICSYQSSKVAYMAHLCTENTTCCLKTP